MSEVVPLTDLLKALAAARTDSCRAWHAKRIAEYMNTTETPAPGPTPSPSSEGQAAGGGETNG